MRVLVRYLKFDTRILFFGPGGTFSLFLPSVVLNSQFTLL